MKEKITTGTNDRPKDETIAQTGEGLPDDSGPVIDVDEAGTAEIRKDDSETMDTPPMPYDVDKATSESRPQTGMAQEAADHEVAMREAKRKAGGQTDDANVMSVSAVRTPPD